MKKLLKIEATFHGSSTFNHKDPDQFNEKLFKKLEIASKASNLINFDCRLSDSQFV
jgi:hypothetical protein